MVRILLSERQLVLYYAEEKPRSEDLENLENPIFRKPIKAHVLFKEGDCSDALLPKNKVNKAVE